MIGSVASYDSRRGAGQIAPDGGKALVSFFASELEHAGIASLVVGDRLSFDVKTDQALGRSFAVNLKWA